MRGSLHFSTLQVMALVAWECGYVEERRGTGERGERRGIEERRGEEGDRGERREERDRERRGGEGEGTYLLLVRSDG